MIWKRRDHLYRCPLTGHYYDPHVLHRTLYPDAEPVPTPVMIDRARHVLTLPAVTRSGCGYSEEQVLAALTGFGEWLEKKSSTGARSPIAAPSTGVPVG